MIRTGVLAGTAAEAAPTGLVAAVWIFHAALPGRREHAPRTVIFASVWSMPTLAEDSTGVNRAAGGECGHGTRLRRARHASPLQSPLGLRRARHASPLQSPLGLRNGG
jgi:hypothetical protein